MHLDAFGARIWTQESEPPMGKVLYIKNKHY